MTSAPSCQIGSTTAAWGSPVAARGGFADAVAAAERRGELVVQPRMGFLNLSQMTQGLHAVRSAKATTAGTLTVDSYTRVGDMQSAAEAIQHGRAVNGFPIVSHSPHAIRTMLQETITPAMPVQVRHGSAMPGPILQRMVDLGMDATEGGPVSYCLPYGRVPLTESIDNWRAATELLATASSPQIRPHIETFGGCMLGQLCPPGLLVAISVLEGMFFQQHGVDSVSLSLTQQVNRDQDILALQALRRLGQQYLTGDHWHTVLYAYMGLFPSTYQGARDILADAAQIAMRGGADRLIVKTVAEAHRIPTVEENVSALEHAHVSSQGVAAHPQPITNPVEDEARTWIEATLEHSTDLGTALMRAFASGVLDVPHCLHPDNARRARSYINADGQLAWCDPGKTPIRANTETVQPLTSWGLLTALSTARTHYDQIEAT